ncbi:hypothetical protein ACFE04_008435 [Oxalis oulophora]
MKLLYFISSCLIILTILPFEVRSQDFVAKLCDKTSAKDVCNSILQSKKGSKESDLPMLTELVIKDAQSKVSGIQAKIMELNAASNTTKLHLGACEETLTDMGDHMEEAQTGLEEKSYEDIVIAMNDATSGMKSCEEGFKPVPELKDMGSAFDQTCSIAATFADVLSGKTKL